MLEKIWKLFSRQPARPLPEIAQSHHQRIHIDPKKLTIVCDGDSWTYGSEILDPEIAARHADNPDFVPHSVDWQPENDRYRIPRIYSTHLGQLFDANMINLSWPADDNKTILHRIMNFISYNYLATGVSTKNLLVVVGWSSPERNSYWFQDEGISEPWRIWPNDRSIVHKSQEQLWNLYTKHLCSPQEVMSRYVLDIVQFQNFCNAHGIKWICFNSFYQTPKKGIQEWNDLNIMTDLLQMRGSMGSYQTQTNDPNAERGFQCRYYDLIWKTVDDIRYYRKDQPGNTFKSFVTHNATDPDAIFNGWHPSPESHKIWAQELHRYIVSNKLL